MESIEHLISELAALDIKLWVEEGDLCFDAPEGSLEGDLRERVLAAKPVLIARLGQTPRSPMPSAQIAADVTDRRQPPATDTERRLAVLWADCLKTDEICRGDDFFVLGGHSLLLMRLVLRLDAEGLGQIDLGRAMEARTLAKMAALLDASQPGIRAGGPALAVPADGIRAHGTMPSRPSDADCHPNLPPCSRDDSLTDLWQAAATRHAELTALVHGSDCFSYRQLDEWANHLAAGLHSAGVKSGHTVALALPRGPEAVATLIAILKCGAAYLPLDEKMPAQLVERLLATCGTQWLITDRAERERLATIPNLRLLPLEALAASADGLANFADPKVGGGDPAYVMFTSGTTGEPKGVIIPHRGVARLALDPDVLAFRPGDGMAQTAPFGFDASTMEIWAPLLAGARLVFIDDSVLMQPARLEAELRASGVKAMWLTASLANRVADSHPQAFRSLSVLVTGGEVLSIPHLKQIRAACPRLRILNGYGPTENTSLTTVHTVTRDDLASDHVPIGRPIAATRVYILDESLQPVAFGAWGELCAAGDGLALGYAGRPDLTDQVFVPLPGHPEERIYRTGDLARWRADGVIEFGGRRDGQIKLRGHRIECTAIEAILSECAGVQDALVMAVGDGEDKELVAFVASPSKSETAWRKRLAERLPSYMIPARFIVLAELPVNANGKKDRAALARMIAEANGTGKSNLSAPSVSGDRTTNLPLSYGQERLWILQRLAPGSAVYNVPMACEIQGQLDTAAFARALVALEERHQALRLVIRSADDRRSAVHQRLLPAGRLAPLCLDFRSCADPRTAADEKMNAESIRPFFLEKEAPARAFLFQLGDDRWRFLLVVHHIACDGWSVDILLHDLEALYARESGGASPVLPPIEYQYSDYATWQRSFLKSQAGRELLERRTKSLSTVLQPLDLPADRRRPAVRSYEGGGMSIPFDSATSRCIDQLAQEAEVSPFVLLLGLVEVLLYRLCGRGGPSDFALGTLSAGRDRPELSGLVGFFVNTLVVPCHLEANRTFREHLAGVKEEWLAALADQHCPFAHLVESLQLPRDLARNPLFDVLVVWQDSPPEVATKSLFKVASSQPEFPFSKFDLSFHFLKKGRAIELYLEYSKELFETATATGLAHRLQTLIAAVAKTPDTPLAQLDLWLPGEKQQVIEAFNHTQTVLPAQRAIPEPFLDCVRHHPNAPAVLSAQGEAWDYHRFSRRAGAIAAHLTAAGLKRGGLVAVLLHRSPEMMAAIHGILLAGGAYVPLDPDQPATRLREFLNDLGQPLVLATATLQAPLAGCGQFVSFPPVSAEADPESRAAPADLAYIIFTSGSTGRPKGVLIEHHAVLNRILWMQQTFPIGPGDVLLQKTPTTFDVSVWELFWWSWTGAAVAMLGPGQEKDPEALLAAIEKHRVTAIHFVPSMLAAFLDSLESGWLDFRRLATVRRVFVSGEALDAALAERFNRLIYSRLGAELHNLYGPTETTVDVSWQPASPWTGGDILSIGRPIANTRFYILDADNQPLPVGIPGEIAIGGVQVARGYLNRPELTAERFIPDPFDAKSRIYLSGDLGRWKSDGSIEYLGRVDWQVKIRGQRIEPGEIEHALERHPRIRRAIVVPVKNQGLIELHAWLLCETPPDLAEVRQFLRQHLPESMIPARFLALDELPQTASGKLDRSLLMRRAQEALTLPPPPSAPKPKPREPSAVALTTRFEFDDANETLTLSLSFDPRLLPRGAVAALAGQYSSLLKEVADQSLG